jgi:hypothetical protein
MKRRPNLSLRPVPGGFVQRLWMGDCYRWVSFDAGMNLLSFTARTLGEAKAKVTR